MSVAFNFDNNHEVDGGEFVPAEIKDSQSSVDFSLSSPDMESIKNYDCPTERPLVMSDGKPASRAA